MSDEIDRYLLSLFATRSPQTIKWYKKRLTPIRTIDKNISSISLSDLQALYAQLATRQARWLNHPSGRAPEPGGLSPATLRGYVRAWRAFFNWLVDSGAIACSPAAKLKLPPLPAQPPKAVTRSDMELIIESARLSSERDYAILCILADSACRVSGLCSLTLDNLDLDRGQAIVTEKRQTRFLLFSPRTVQAIRDYLSCRPLVVSRALFISKRHAALTPAGVYQLLDRIAGVAQVTGRHNPHSFRHGWIINALRSGAELTQVAQIAGHGDVMTTYTYYARWLPAELHEVHDRYTWLRGE